MNILFYMPTVLVGGVRTVTEILSHEFRERGHKVSWLLRYRVYNDERDYPDGESCVYLPTRELLSDENVDFYNKLLLSNSIDIVINQDGLFEGVKLINTHRVPVVEISVLHNNPLLNSQWLLRDISTLKNQSFVEKIKRIGRIILYFRIKRFLSSSIKHQMKLLEKSQSEIVVLSPRYIDAVKKINPQISEVFSIANPNTYQNAKIVPKEKIALYVGRLDNRSKKITYLIDIWKSVSSYANDWKLIIVGEGQDKETLIEYSKKIKSIEFVGYHVPTEYYQRASIFCMTSLFEGFPMVLPEAMQHGCVPIAFNSFPAILDIIHNDDGVVVDAFDKREYARQLLRLINDKVYRERLSANARNNISIYDRNIIADEWESFFNKVINKKCN